MPNKFWTPWETPTKDKPLEGEIPLKPGTSPLSKAEMRLSNLETTKVDPAVHLRQNQKTLQDQKTLSEASLTVSLDDTTPNPLMEYATDIISDMEDPEVALNRRTLDGWRLVNALHIGNRVRYIYERILWKKNPENQ
jgi:hypothetical protein